MKKFEVTIRVTQDYTLEIFAESSQDLCGVSTEDFTTWIDEIFDEDAEINVAIIKDCGEEEPLSFDLVARAGEIFEYDNCDDDEDEFGCDDDEEDDAEKPIPVDPNQKPLL